MYNFNERTPLNPQSPEDGLSAVDREVLEFFGKLELEHGLTGLDLPWDVLSGLTRYMNRNLHPVDTAEFCNKAGNVLKDMGSDMAEIATDAKKQCH